MSRPLGVPKTFRSSLLSQQVKDLVLLLLCHGFRSLTPELLQVMGAEKKKKSVQNVKTFGFILKMKTIDIFIIIKINFKKECKHVCVTGLPYCAVEN